MTLYLYHIIHKIQLSVSKRPSKINNDIANKPDMYLKAQIGEVECDQGTKCWTVPSAEILKGDIPNVENCQIAVIRHIH